MIKVTLAVKDNAGLATLLAAVEGAATLIEAVPMKEAKTKAMRYVNGARNKGISGQALLFETLKSGAKTPEEISKVFVARGFAKTSHTACISQAVKDKKARRVKDGKIAAAV